MTWWTTVAGLTPLAIHDAKNVSGAQLLDRIGGNHITATSTLSPSGGLYEGVAGNGATMSYASSVTLPTNGVIAAFVMAPSEIVVFLDSATGGIMLVHGGDGGWYTGDTWTSFALMGNTALSADFQFLTYVKTGNSGQMYVNGVQVGGQVSGKTQSSIDTIGETTIYNFASNESISALGIWSGTATQAEVQALEAGCRSAMQHDILVRGYASMLGILPLAPPQALDAAGVRNTNYAQSIGMRDQYFGGTGQIVGTVAEKATPTNLPLARRVVLIDDATRTVIRETWSNAAGDYTFTHIDLTQTYTAIAWDHTKTYRAVAADGLTPTRM